MEQLRYRPDIDGLRAVAILVVIFYHAEIAFFSGGYIGVDVFFVISGFLITTIIVREIEKGQFSFVRFYERRLRRIFPALFTVVPVVLLVTVLLFDSDNARRVGKSGMSVILFVSNMFFWREAGYFDEPSSLKPLLHAWSLSVEEQFYIFLPILLFVIARIFKSRSTLILSLILLASFIASVIGMKHDPSGVFYLMLYRAWELLSGSVVALKTFPGQGSKLILSILSMLGLVMIVSCANRYTDTTPFPGAAAVLPVLGSALIILTGTSGKSMIHKFLSLPPMVFIGKISYSLYLWHWPIFVFSRYYAIRPLTPLETTLAILASIGISILTWKYIENPFRSQFFLKRPLIFVVGGGAMFVMLIISSAIYLGSGRASSISARDDIPDVNAPASRSNCQSIKLAGVNEEAILCSIGADTLEAEFLVWGDSHAEAVAPAIHMAASDAGVGGVVVSMPACPPLPGIDQEGGSAGTCVEFNNMVMSYIRVHPELKTIVLVARWAFLAEGTRYKAEEGPEFIFIDRLGASNYQTEDLVMEGLTRVVSKLILLNRSVVIVAQVPEVGFDVPSSLFIAKNTGRDVNEIIAPTYQEYLTRNKSVIESIAKLAKKYTITIIDPSVALCNSDRCIVSANGKPLYDDGNHLSIYGAEYIAYLFDSIFNLNTMK